LSCQIRVLCESPERWSNIYALSRRPPSENVHHVPLDFLNNGPEQIAAEMSAKGIKADVLFFYAYLQPPAKEGEGIWQNAQALVDVNGAPGHWQEVCTCAPTHKFRLCV
jgi:hypothetical protein